MQNSPPALSVIANLTSGQLLENGVSLDTEESGQHIGSADRSPTSPDQVGQCASSQLAEGRCLTIAVSAAPFEQIAVERARKMTSPSPDKPTVATVNQVPGHSIYPLAILGSVIVGAVALVSIVAIAFGGSVSFTAKTSPSSHSFEMETNHQPDADVSPSESPLIDPQDLAK